MINLPLLWSNPVDERRQRYSHSRIHRHRDLASVRERPIKNRAKVSRGNGFVEIDLELLSLEKLQLCNPPTTHLACIYTRRCRASTKRRREGLCRLRALRNQKRALPVYSWRERPGSCRTFSLHTNHRRIELYGPACAVQTWTTHFVVG